MSGAHVLAQIFLKLKETFGRRKGFRIFPHQFWPDLTFPPVVEGQVQEGQDIPLSINGATESWEMGLQTVCITGHTGLSGAERR